MIYKAGHSEIVKTIAYISAMTIIGLMVYGVMRNLYAEGDKCIVTICIVAITLFVLMFDAFIHGCK